MKNKKQKRIEIRVTEFQKNYIQGLADIYSNGNITELLIDSVMNKERRFHSDKFNDVLEKIEEGKTPSN